MSGSLHNMMEIPETSNFHSCPGQRGASPRVPFHRGGGRHWAIYFGSLAPVHFNEASSVAAQNPSDKGEFFGSKSPFLTQDTITHLANQPKTIECRFLPESVEQVAETTDTKSYWRDLVIETLPSHCAEFRRPPARMLKHRLRLRWFETESQKVQRRS